MNSYARPLDDARQVQNFVEKILGITKIKEVTKAVKLILTTELQNANTEGRSTLNTNVFRFPGYVDERARIELREQVFEELISKERPVNDDHIRLGSGGALPRETTPKTGKQAYLVIGLPASGKSTIANTISDNFGAIILDSDFAKRKLPEYSMDFGASLVHDESIAIVFGEQTSSEFNMLEYCCTAQFNVVIPRIGHKTKPILELTQKLIDWEYDVHLTLVSLDRQKATQRAFYRFSKTRRYVPLSLIFDGYSNEPMLSYYKLRSNSCFKSVGAVSTDVKKECLPEFIEGDIENPAKLFSN